MTTEDSRMSDTAESDRELLQMIRESQTLLGANLRWAEAKDRLMHQLYEQLGMDRLMAFLIDPAKRTQRICWAVVIVTLILAAVMIESMVGWM